MKKNLLIITILLIGIIAVYFLELNDRLYNNGDGFSYMTFIDNEYRLGDEKKDKDYPKELYKRNFLNEDYKFPRIKVDDIKIYRNVPFVSRLTGKSLSENQRLEVQKFFNSPENFDWAETTWTLRESDYILRFFNQEQVEIGKVWLCLNNCGMTFSNPFSLNMKFGSLSNAGIKKIESILKL
ncbi:hypothetical protein [Winogradskyella sp.]|uniref:hypothetical protein n=1 Tax=Winogradskyella sp. TaxID=1883156 RepID=UPI00261E979A|nr:hypothetical protein [Winogradskyella sp.]